MTGTIREMLAREGKILELVKLKANLDELVGIEIPFQLHTAIFALTELLEKAGY